MRADVDLRPLAFQRKAAKIAVVDADQPSGLARRELPEALVSLGRKELEPMGLQPRRELTGMRTYKLMDRAELLSGCCRRNHCCLAYARQRANIARSSVPKSLDSSSLASDYG